MDRFLVHIIHRFKKRKKVPKKENYDYYYNTYYGEFMTALSGGGYDQW